MKIVVLFQIRTGDGNPERTKQNRRPAWASKKEWEFSTMADVDGYTAPRVHEPVGWAISNRFQPVSSGIFEIRFDSSQFAQPCRIDSEKKWTFEIRGDHRWWMVQRFLSLDPSSPCADSWCWLEFQGAGRLHHDDLKGAAAPFPHCVAVMNDLERAGSSN